MWRSLQSMHDFGHSGIPAVFLIVFRRSPIHNFTYALYSFITGPKVSVVPPIKHFIFNWNPPLTGFKTESS